MGSVYLAHDLQLDRQVALKVPHITPADPPELLARFQREARAAATFDHAGLCPVYDVGQIDGIHFLTMPYIAGKPLADAIDPSKPIPLRQAAAVVRKLALTLQEAHARGVIHRDLKPANILVSQTRELVIIDFGLARRVDSDDSRITHSGAILGTPAYMAPEQVAGDPSAVGRASDIYSLGVILYELMTGHCPFEGRAAMVLGLIVVANPPLPSSFRPEIDPALEAICLKAMAKKAADRYATMTDFAAALDNYLHDAGTLAPPAVEDMASRLPADSPHRAPPAGAETLAGQWIAGLIPSLEEEPGLALAAGRDSPPQRPRMRGFLLAAAGAATLTLLGIIVLVPTHNYKQEVRTVASASQVAIKKQEMKLPVPVGPAGTPKAPGPASKPEGTPPEQPPIVKTEKGAGPDEIEDKPVAAVPEPPAPPPVPPVFSGRQGSTRLHLLQSEGGTAGSEAAVEGGLAWLVRHQRPDGSWSLNFQDQCRGNGCPGQSEIQSDTAATGLALLSLLGAGYSHAARSRYQDNVRRGLTWLVRQQQDNGNLFPGEF
jgi:hypothetical protein